jgi:hypothetical protein
MNKALRLAKLILPHMPEDASEITVLQFGDKIVRSLIASGNSQDYLEIIHLTSGIDIDSLIQLGVTEVFKLFVEGMRENEILSLIEFYKGL